MVSASACQAVEWSSLMEADDSAWGSSTWPLTTSKSFSWGSFSVDEPQLVNNSYGQRDFRHVKLYSDKLSCFISKVIMLPPRTPWWGKISSSQKTAKHLTLPRSHLLSQNASFCWVMSHLLSIRCLCLALNPKITLQRHLDSPKQSSCESKKAWVLKLLGVPNL